MAAPSTDSKKPRYSWREVLTLSAFKPALRDMRFSLEERLAAYGHREIVVIGQDPTKTTVKVMTKSRQGWTSRDVDRSEDIGDRAVIGLLGFEDIPYVGHLSKKDEAALALQLAVNAKSAGVEISDTSSHVQTVWLGSDNNHLIWRVPAGKVKNVERMAGSAPVVRVTHGLASVIRLALESLDPAKHPDAILCGDHGNFAWLDVISGRVQDTLKPHYCPTPTEFSEWMFGNLAQAQMDRTLEIELWTSEFCWLKEIPVFGDDHSTTHASFTHRIVPVTEQVFA